MVSSSYPNKTNRNEQWLKIKASKKWTRKTLKVWERYFFEGVYEGKTDIDRNLLFLHPNQSIESWQNILNNYFEVDPARWDNYYKGDDLAEKSFESIQKCFLGHMNLYFFHAQDRAWIFRQIFGERYQADKEFPFILVGERENCVITCKPQEIAASMFVDVKKVFRGKQKSTYVMHSLSYLESLIKYIPIEAYSLSEPVDDSCYSVWSCLNRAINILDKDAGGAVENINYKKELAKKIKTLFDNYNGDLGQYSELVKLAGG